MFRSFGGRKEIPRHLVGAVNSVDELDPADVAWNFGVLPPPVEVRDVVAAKKPLYAALPKLQGAWDGSTVVNHLEAVRKVLGDKAEDLVQYQPRGTCGGRAGSATIDIVQCILIASGKRAKFHRASHAFVYWQARKKYGMDNGSPGNENNDGVASGSVPEILSTIGIDNRDETGDVNYYGSGSDDLACQWGTGHISADLAAKLEGYAKDNVIDSWHPVKSAQELADGIAAGGVGIGSDNQGFTMSRDARGFCRPTGTWSHYQIRPSVGVWGGQKGFGYFQSWGRTTPSGPLLPGHFGNCFGVDFDVQDRIIRSGDWAVVFGFPLWELENGPLNLSWVF
jgi:hypothetical protein